MTNLTKNNDFFNVVEKELNALYSPFSELKTDLSHLEILDTDPEEVIDQKEKDAKAKKKQFTPIRTGIQKVAKSYRDDFNKASKDVIALEKKYTSDIKKVEEFLKTQIDYKKNRAEIIANQINEERLQEISQYEGFYNPIFFGNMTQAGWQTFKSETISKYEDHVKQEEERVAREKFQKEEAERLRAENERLKKEAQERKAQEIESQARIENRGDSENVGGGRESANCSELQLLNNAINDLIDKAVSPTDPKELEIFNNVIEMLNKTKGYLEFYK